MCDRPIGPDHICNITNIAVAANTTEWIRLKAKLLSQPPKRAAVLHNLQVPITTSQKFRSESTYTEEKFVVDINL